MELKKFTINELIIPCGPFYLCIDPHAYVIPYYVAIL